MSREDLFFKQLVDFTDLRRKNDEFSSTTSKTSGKSNPFEGELDFSNNEKLIRQFKELKEKIKELSKENQILREEMNSQHIQVRQLNQAEKNLMAINFQIKQKNQQLNLANDEFKKKLALIKEELKEKRSKDDELQFMKTTVLELKLTIDRLSEEKNKIMEISIQDKMSIEETVNKLKIKAATDEKYLHQMEGELNKIKSKNVQLENEFRKIQIRYDQELFNKKWSKQNFQKEHYDTNMKDLQTQLKQMHAKNKKQKEKRGELEKRVLELEEMAGLWSVKAETYEGQVSLLEKKIKKIQKKMQEAKSYSEKLSIEKLNWEERFLRCAAISEELINRVKRQIMGDAVQLAKSCQFKLNKLKEEPRQPSRQKSTHCRKTNEKSKNKNPNSDECTNTNFRLTAKKNLQSEDEIKVLSQTNRMNRLQQVETHQMQSSHLTFGKKSSQNVMANEYENIELKIRKQREEMQKKLRQKMMYRKIDVSSSPDKSKLRQEYLKYILEK